MLYSPVDPFQIEGKIVNSSSSLRNPSKKMVSLSPTVSINMLSAPLLCQPVSINGIRHSGRVDTLSWLPRTVPHTSASCWRHRLSQPHCTTWLKTEEMWFSQGKSRRCCQKKWEQIWKHSRWILGADSAFMGMLIICYYHIFINESWNLIIRF